MPGKRSYSSNGRAPKRSRRRFGRRTPYRRRRYTGRKGARTTYSNNRKIVAQAMHKAQVDLPIVWGSTMENEPESHQTVVPYVYHTMFPGTSSAQVTGNKIYSKQLRINWEIQFPESRVAGTAKVPLMRFVQGFIKLDYDKDVAAVTGEPAIYDLPNGICRSEATEDMTTYANKQIEDIFIKMGGEFDVRANVNTNLFKLISDRTVSFCPEASQIVDDVQKMYTAAKSMNWTWNLNKTIYLQDCTTSPTASVSEFRRPMNTAGQWIPVLLALWLNHADFVSANDQYRNPTIRQTQSHFFLDK